MLGRGERGPGLRRRRCRRPATSAAVWNQRTAAVVFGSELAVDRARVAAERVELALDALHRRRVACARVRLRIGVAGEAGARVDQLRHAAATRSRRRGSRPSTRCRSTAAAR